MNDLEIDIRSGMAISQSRCGLWTILYFIAKSDVLDARERKLIWTYANGTNISVLQSVIHRFTIKTKPG